MENIIFNAEKHEYSVNGVVVPSVTQVISQVFGYKFGNVKGDVLARACEKGKAVHSEISDYLINGVNGFSEEFQAVKDEIKKSKLIALEIEKSFCGKTDFGSFCGTCDTFFSCGLLIDYKTSKSLDKASVTRQLNMYAFMLRQAGYDVNKLEAWHIVGNKLKRVELPLYSDRYAINIMKFYSEGKKAKSDIDIVEIQHEEIQDSFLESSCDKLKKIDDVIGKLEKQRSLIIENLKDYFSLQGSKSYERNDMSISYVPASVRRTFDSARFKKEMGEEEYNKWTKVSESTPQVRVRYKGEKHAN